LTTDEFKQIKARYEAASPAESWLCDAFIDDNPEDINIGIMEHGYSGVCPETLTQVQAERDTVFAAHARTDLPACVAEIERLQNKLRWIKAELRTDNSEGNKLNRINKILEQK